MSVPLAVLLWLFLLGCSCVPAKAQGRFRILEYNCENLFDTVHAPGKEDQAFLPSAVRRWDGRRFWQKLLRLSKAIIACGEGHLPDLVALCEVENDSCVQALVRRSPLRNAGYEYVLTDSPDRRGINVALLYQPGTFRFLSSTFYRMPPERVKGRPTRDILHVTGLVYTLDTLDTLDVFVCHLPSRLGGRKATEKARLYVAGVLKDKADSVVKVRKTPMVVMVGDFNDEPENASLQSLSDNYLLLAKDARGTFHPREVKGTYYYKGIWNRFDQFLINRNWGAGHASFRPAEPKVARIMDFPFLLETDKVLFLKRPFSFYRGMRYNGGYSDHLPICLDFVYEQ